jgi:hypothetical protein
MAEARNFAERLAARLKPCPSRACGFVALPFVILH